MNEPITDEVLSMRQLAIVERYEDFIHYMYPIAINLPRAHSVLKEMFIASLLGQVDLFNQAGKSGQVSRLYQADAGLATLRFYLRVMVRKPIKGITPQQHKVAAGHLAEVGKMLGSWIRDGKGVGRKAAIGTTPATPARAT